MKDKDITDNTQSTDASNSTKLAVTLDQALYERYLEKSDLTEEQKQEFLQTLWNIIVSFVDLGFEVHPAQQAEPKINPTENKDSQARCNLLEKNNPTNQTESNQL